MFNPYIEVPPPNPPKLTPYAGTPFNDLAKLLFKCLTTTSPDFEPSTYLNEFLLKKSNLERADFVYKDIKKYPAVFAKFSKDTKDDSQAVEYMDSGRVKCDAGNYWEALREFNRAVSMAESEDTLALAYGCRAKCFLNLDMPDQFFKEVDRAQRHYPQDQIQSLHEMKEKAKREDLLERQGYYESVPGSDVSEENQSVQCAKNCVKIEENADFGRHVVATRDIQIGEIIASERPFATALTSERSTHCHHCLNISYNPIPCNKCTVALFCNEDCKYKARDYHKYECPILLTICYRVLCEFAIDDSMLLALKIALVAKDDYSKLDVSTPKDKNYRSDRYREIHFLDSKATFSSIDLFHQAILTALVFELLWNYTSFFSGIFSSSDTEKHFKELLLHQLQIAPNNSAKIYEYVYKKFEFDGTSNFGLGAYSFFPLFTHSCCANVMKTYHGTTMVLRALNTIKEGEQCFVNRYGLRYDVCPKQERNHFILTHKLPKCKCKACEENWIANLGDLEEICADLNIGRKELGEIVRDVIGTDVKKAENLLPDIIERLKKCEDLEPQGNALALKNLIVHCYVVFGNKRIENVERDIVFVP